MKIILKLFATLLLTIAGCSGLLFAVINVFIPAHGRILTLPVTAIMFVLSTGALALGFYWIKLLNRQLINLKITLFREDRERRIAEWEVCPQKFLALQHAQLESSQEETLWGCGIGGGIVFLITVFWVQENLVTRLLCATAFGVGIGILYYIIATLMTSKIKAGRTIKRTDSAPIPIVLHAEGMLINDDETIVWSGSNSLDGIKILDDETIGMHVLEITVGKTAGEYRVSHDYRIPIPEENLEALDLLPTRS